jgi:flavin prenyltransferase
VSNMKNRKPLVVAISGASGSVYGLRFVKAAAELDIPIALTMSRASCLVIREELGIEITEDERKERGVHPLFLEQLFPKQVIDRISYYPEEEMTAPIASGSFPTRGMAVIPASTTCFSKIANGISDSLLERSAECTIKEGRQLVIVPRETPLSAIHLENLLKLARIGVRVVPAIPAFYSGAQKVEELVEFVVGKVLDQFTIEHALYRRWTGSEVDEKWSVEAWLKR